MKFICPICKYNHLFEKPYDENGNSSYEICPCCGFQFGCDDFPDKEIRIAQWKEKWQQAGKPWFSNTRKPPNNRA